MNKLNLLVALYCLLLTIGCNEKTAVPSASETASRTPIQTSATSKPAEKDLLGAAETGDLEAVKRLVSEGADVNKTRPEDNQTALHLASAAGHAEVVLYLLQQPEIYPPAPDKDRKRASDLAAASGHQEVVEMLAAADAVFHSAEVSQAGKLPELKKNLARWPELANAASGGDTALLQASRRQNAEVIACLIEHGADVNAQGKSGDTPLHIWATLGTKKEIGELLLSAGADVNAKNKEGKTPIFGAAGPRVLLLLDNGADVNVVARGGISLLHSAAFSDSVSPEALEAILAKATDVNVKDETGRTALSYCKDEKKRAIFLKHGAKE